MNKAYANRKKKEERPEGDFYSTPKSLIWVAKDIIKQEFDEKVPIQEPCAGKGAISNTLAEEGYSVVVNDLYWSEGYNYLERKSNYKFIITNPPFSIWDDFVFKAKSHCDKFMFIGRLNYLSTNSRLKSGIWENLKAVYIFNRYVDYRTPYREDGLFNVGAMATGWFLWDAQYVGKPYFEFLDVQQYAKLGNFKEKLA